MARPNSRRPGQNRRAQYGLFASYVITIFGTIVGLFMVIISMADPVGFSFIRAAGAEATRPVAIAFTWVAEGAASFEENVTAYIKAGSQNVTLRRQVDANRAKLIEARAIAVENAQLKRLLNLVKTTDNSIASATLISSNSVSTRRIARISAGSGAGVQVGMPVRAAEGLVGRVLMTSPNTASVLLITDSQSIVPVRDVKGGTAATCSGKDDGTVEVKALGTDVSPFKVGDVVVSSGTGGLYPPNIPVAVIVRITAGSAIGVPLANPARVGAVVVQRAYDAAMTPEEQAAQAGSAPPAGAPAP